MKKKILFCTLILAMAFASGACNKNTETAEEPAVETENNMEFSELTADQIDIFEISATSFNDEVIAGKMSVDEMDARQEKLMSDYISMGDLPDNAVELFREWKDSVNFHSNLADKIIEAENKKQAEIIENTVKTEVQQSNKPQASEAQQNTQIKEATSKPITPSNNTPSDGEVVGTPGERISAGGGTSTITRSEDVIGDTSATLNRALQSEANRIASEQGISYEQALAQVKADWGL